MRAITATTGSVRYDRGQSITSQIQNMALPRTAPKQMDLNATRGIARAAEKLVTKRIWLPKLLYDSLPWFYLIAGLAALFGTIYVSNWLWIVPHYFLFSFACLHLAVAVYLKRRGGRKESGEDQ